MRFCRLIFVRSKTNDSDTKTTKTLILCFAHEKNLEILKYFEKLFLKQYYTSIEKENDWFKLQSIEVLRNAHVIYFSPYMLKLTEDIKKINEKYLNINEHGLTFNDKDVT